MSQTKPTIRILILMILVCTVFTGLAGRLYYLQLMRADETRARSEKARVYIKELPPVRGRILDRNQRVLAHNVWRYSVIADKRRMVDPRATIAEAAELLGLSREEIDRHVEATVGTRGRVLAYDVPESIKETLEAQNLPGISFKKHDSRFYPEGELAAQVIGFTGRENEGLEGLELSLNEWMVGAEKQVLADKDPRRNMMAHDDYNEVITQGADVVLTIDGYIQYIVERELEAAMERHEPIQAYGVVMNPKTGDVLALASVPRFDPNNYDAYSAEIRKNRAIANIFEPGSVLKPFTIAGVLEEGAARPDTMIHCEDGSYRVWGRTIQDDIHEYGLMSLHDIMVYSSNIGTVKAVQLLTEQPNQWREQASKLHHYLRAFGFRHFEKSTYDLPGESGGVLRPPQEWTPASIAGVPYGQEMSTNALILTNAYCALANRGLYRPARIIRGFQGQDGLAIEREPEEFTRVVSPGVAEEVVRMLVDVTEYEDGTGRYVRIPGFHVAGKTGTAQKYDPEAGTYGRGMRIVSFCGFFPAEDPEVVMSIVVDEPRKGKYGGSVAGPVWKAIAEEIIAYWGMAPSNRLDPLLQEAVEEETPERDMDPAELTFGVTKVLPSPEPMDWIGSKSEMPDLIGLSARDAALRLSLAGVPVELKGSGKVTWQEPPAGAALTRETKASILCEPALIDSSLTDPAQAIVHR